MRKLIIMLMLTLMVLPMAHGFAQERGFSDIPNNSKDSGLIQWAATNKIMTGYSDGTFRPDKPVTNAEYTTALMRLYGEPVVHYTKKKQHWSDDYYIVAAVQGEITWGFNDSKLRDAVMTIHHVRQVIDFRGDVFTRIELVKYLKRFSEKQNSQIIQIVDAKWK
ncbi:S-layer homology domain-containing protein [Cohnella abietis]|uniref:SLH domain-containing protein n=1 Tax=Cohnella abietis TaxID=2507935 RepID=A0A3T1CY12_9BACL|nr:S-layer homology domain-containing protein [Cohnella abietis]BBI30752.1 hypothetical protein KCTCHS21_01510 [Cohnella abietis]